MFYGQILGMNLNPDDFNNNIHEFVSSVTNVLYQRAEMCQGEPRGGEGGGGAYTDHWECLLWDKDDSRVWRAID